MQYHLNVFDRYRRSKTEIQPKSTVANLLFLPSPQVIKPSIIEDYLNLRLILVNDVSDRWSDKVDVFFLAKITPSQQAVHLELW